jgi:LysM domain
VATKPKPKPKHTVAKSAKKPAPKKKTTKPPTGLAALTLKGRGTPGQLRGGHTVLIQALTRPTQINALLGAAGARLTGGFGNWQAVDVPRNVPLTEWTGRSLFTMDIDLLLDGWGAQRSVEADIASIELLALMQGIKPRGRDVHTTPPIRLFGAVPHPEKTWVISGIDWGDALRDFSTGARLRQALTLHLIEYQEDATLLSDTRGAATPSGARKYKVKKGDDLKKIAAHQLGKSARWPDIVKLNKGLRGWKLGPKWVGKTIKIPSH